MKYSTNILSITAQNNKLPRFFTKNLSIYKQLLLSPSFLSLLSFLLDDQSQLKSSYVPFVRFPHTSFSPFPSISPIRLSLPFRPIFSTFPSPLSFYQPFPPLLLQEEEGTPIFPLLFPIHFPPPLPPSIPLPPSLSSPLSSPSPTDSRAHLPPVPTLVAGRDVIAAPPPPPPPLTRADSSPSRSSRSCRRGRRLRRSAGSADSTICVGDRREE